MAAFWPQIEVNQSAATQLQAEAGVDAATARLEQVIRDRAGEDGAKNARRDAHLL